MSNQDTTALTTIASQGGFSSAQVDLIKSQIAPDASDDQLALFLEVCRGTGLNPFMHQIYAVFRNEKKSVRNGPDYWVKRMTIQTGIDGYRLLAARTGELAGIDDATYDSEDGEQPNRATVTVYRFVRRGYSSGERVAFTATARWREYVQTTKDGEPTSMWTKMPYLMLAKCAEALALRKAFPAELSGIYTGEEMAQADNEPRPTPPTTPVPTPTPTPITKRQRPLPTQADLDEEDSALRAMGGIVDEEPTDTAAEPVEVASIYRPTYHPLEDANLMKLLRDVGVLVVADQETFVADAQASYPRIAANDLRAACYKELARRKMLQARAKAEHRTAENNIPDSLESLATGKRGN